MRDESMKQEERNAQTHIQKGVSEADAEKSHTRRAPQTYTQLRDRQDMPTKAYAGGDPARNRVCGAG